MSRVDNIDSGCADAVWDYLTSQHFDEDDAQIVVDALSLRDAIKEAIRNEAARAAEDAAGD